jgi:8-oxo-dGTP pyrophosphatase MutT (NUDIX family)
MPWTPRFSLSPSDRRIALLPASTATDPDATAALAELVDVARRQRAFPNLRGPCAEQHFVLGTRPEVRIERDAVSNFGIVTQGVHMNIFTRTAAGKRIWVPRRSRHLYMHPGMLDNAVAGGLSAGETPFECIVREAEEEASLPRELVERDTRAVGTLSWFSANGDRLQPGLQYVYDLEVGEDVQLRPHDDEVEAFYLWDAKRVLDAVRGGEFKPSCAVVLVDFFVRHGLLTPEGERDYAEIVSRIHRRLPFPVCA